jgi:hypothetical protein
MAYLQKLRTFFAALTHRKPNPGQNPQDAGDNRQEGDPHHKKQPNLQQEQEDSDSDPYDALSEVAAPEPIERLSERELGRHPSLEQTLQDYETSRNDPFGALSEIAAPEPVERFSVEEIARHPSLEQRLSSISHH